MHILSEVIFTLTPPLSSPDQAALVQATRSLRLPESVRRGAKILRSLADGKAPGIVAREQHVGYSTVMKAVTAYRTAGVEGLLSTVPVNGRPRLSPKKRQLVLDLGADLNRSIASIAEEAGVSIGSASGILKRRSRGLRKPRGKRPKPS